MNLSHYVDSMSHFGVGPTAYHATYRLLNRVTRVALWKALVLTTRDVDVDFLDAARREGARMVTPAELHPYVADPETLLTHPFLDAAAERRDRAVAFFEADRLISYGWYSCRPMPLVELDPSLVLHFDPSWTYAYNGFTVPRARGRRLHEAGLAHGLLACVRDGYSGNVTYIDSSNFASLRSSHRLGFRDVGYLAMLNVGLRYLCASSRGCRPYGLAVKHVTQEQRERGRVVAVVMDG
jgi:hypothetical protein